MRTIALMTALLSMTAYSSAQQLRFPPSTAATALANHGQEKSNFDRPGRKDSNSSRRWYWEYTDTAASPSTAMPSPAVNPAIAANNIDFSPVNVSWNLSGTHKLVPTFEVVGFEMTPRLHAMRPPAADTEYLSAAQGRLWYRASHAIMAALRN